METTVLQPEHVTPTDPLVTLMQEELPLAGGASGMNAGGESTENLSVAFRLFNQLSSQLTDSYQCLENQVRQLSSELKHVRAKRAEDQHEKQCMVHRFESLLHLLPGGVVVLDQHGVVIHSNPAASELLGEPLLGQLWIDVIHRSFSPRSDDGHEISLRDGRRISIATRSLDEVEPGQIILLTDQTETRKLQKQLSRHERLSAMGKMMSSLAHQVRTPLSAAMLYASHLVEDDLTTEQRRKFSQKVLSRLVHLEQTVKEMLLFVKGDVKLTETVRVRLLLEKLYQEMEIAAQQQGVRLKVEAPVAEVAILCNQETIVSALSNLVENALQAVASRSDVGREVGQVTVSVIVSQVDRVKIIVADNGPGMDKKTLAAVQEAFFTTKAHGTGLGLSVVQAVAEAHHGHFFMHSKPDVGTVAGIELPCQPTSTETEE